VVSARTDKVLFLDIDGVLNSRESYESGRTKSAMRDPVDPLAVAQLQRIIDETGCTVVLSSSWRIGRYLSDIRGMLIKAGARHPFPLIDKTPDLSRVDGHLYIGIRRGEEVKAWVDGFEPNVYVCLDDDQDFNPGQPLVHCDHDFGLTAEKADECIRILNAAANP
jgi:hypothetical protein